MYLAHSITEAWIPVCLMLCSRPRSLAQHLKTTIIESMQMLQWQ